MTNANKENMMNSELLAIAVLVKEQNIKSSFVRDLRIVELLKSEGLSWVMVDKVNEIIENL
jgi:hypothetical protein